MIKLLSSKKVDNDLTKDDLITKFAPIICKPKSGAFMSVKHSLGIPTIKLYIKYLLDHYDELFEVYIILFYYFILLIINRNQQNVITI